jgi:hypothetical protein
VALGEGAASDRLTDLVPIGRRRAEVLVAKPIAVALEREVSAWWTSRSIIATAVTPSPKISPQAEKGLFEVTIIEARS